MISYELPLTLAIARRYCWRTLSLRGIVESPSRLLLGFHSALEHFPGAIPADFRLSHFPDLPRLRRPTAFLRSARSGERTGCRISYRIQQHEVCVFLHGRIRQHGHGRCMATTVVSGRLAPLFPAPIFELGAAAVLFLAGAASVLYHGLQPARKWIIYFSGFWLRFWRWQCCLHPAAAVISGALFWFAAKSGLLLFVFIWIRATLPRFRYDQLMHFAWTFLFPCALVNLLLTALLVALFPGELNRWICFCSLSAPSSRLSAASIWFCRIIRFRARYR